MEAVPLSKARLTDAKPTFVGAKVGLYLEPPRDEVRLEEFELFALERLRVLKDVEGMALKGLAGKNYIHKMGELAKVYPLDTPEGQRKDLISHFTLRFAYCRPDDRSWFVKQETDLFRYRLNQIGINNFLAHNRLQFETIPEEEFSSFQPQLKQLTEYLAQRKKKYTARRGIAPPKEPTMSASDFYRVEFEQALELVKSRKGFLHKGWVYLHTNDLVSVVVSRFKTSLNEGLDAAYKAFPQIQRDERVGPLIENLPKQYVGPDWSNQPIGRAITPTELDSLSQRSFPLCMRVMHEKLRKNHHLKNTARLQYGLFLKGIGLTLEDAINFWRTEFIRKMPAEKFDKEYAYHIRHSYGKEGKKESYTPYSCQKIIMQMPGASEDHGCPFRCFNRESLVNTLRSYGCSGSQIEAILVEVDEKRWGHACRLYFQAKHEGCNVDRVAINHPQEYFKQSDEFYNSGDKQEQN